MIELRVTGMSCQHCLRAVKDTLEGVAGVTRVERVELDSGCVLVEGTADPRALAAAVKGAGYEAQIVTA